MIDGKFANPACDFGEKLGVPLYRFLKDALIRNYSKEWYGRISKGD